ncbi:hypothetical protein ST39-O_gp03 [Clostridium phage phiCP39-O]|uniref:hypothetical protein n=1 Tax=Clostridium phage phiCP39-O TaxID=541865 RepID=UPI000181BE6A|nr:hypothetical protein ST39-O_gp03 [Clostridium phage phiCP39-O]YP_007003989.1 hypothetical protein F431_gp03 [Clostridium phage phiCP26F]ACE81985.1 hypothetical protein [Clostridium phage phiCP39-O]AEA86227.1 hypothetical protein [Clostridium phage phiCP26F]AEI74536.1 protein of unknown function DUF3310 [Clostridium phage phiCP9O]
MNKDMVNHPNHYNKGKYEVIDVIEDWGLGFSLGNAIKYIARCEHKGNKKQDLEKAIFYIERVFDSEDYFTSHIITIGIDEVLKDWNLSPMLTLAVYELFIATREKRKLGKVITFIKKELEKEE